MNKPEIVNLPLLKILGMSFYGDPFAESSAWTEENEIGRLWKRFMDLFSPDNGDRDIKHYFKSANTCYELHIEHEETIKTGHYEIFIGMEISEKILPPYYMQIKIIPEGLYLLVTLQGDKMMEDTQLSINKWLDENNYTQAHSFTLQRYDERFKGMHRLEESEIDLLIPIKDNSNA